MARSAGRSPSWNRGSGLKVFDRGARGVALTIEGQRLFLRTSEAFALISDNTDRWVEPRGAAVVRLASIPSICALWLIPRLSALESGKPPLRIVLEVDIRQTDLADEGIDLSVRCGRGGIPGRISVQLFEEHCFPIASPELAEKIGSGRARAAAQISADPRFRTRRDGAPGSARMASTTGRGRRTAASRTTTSCSTRPPTGWASRWRVRR